MKRESLFLYPSHSLTPSGTSLITFSPGILSPQLMTLSGGVGVRYPLSYATEKFISEQVFLQGKHRFYRL